MTTLDTLTAPLRRSTDLNRIVTTLADLSAATVDVVAPQSAMRYRTALGDGYAPTDVEVSGDEPILLSDGVADMIAATPTRTAQRQIAERLRIPMPFFDRLAAHDDIDGRHLLDTNVNTLAGLDRRSALYRFLRADDAWSLRAVLSDRFAAIDNIDVLRSVGDGFAASGIELPDAEVDVDLTPDRFRMRIACPQIEHAVPDLLDGYRSPFGVDGPTAPVMWAGIEIANSETGHGALTIAPRAVIVICRNGMTRPVEFRRAHLGVALDEGVVNWSNDTRQAVLGLVTSQIADAVNTFLSTNYLARLADEMRAARGIDVPNPAQTIEVVQRRHDLTETETQNVLSMFVRSGDTSVLGVGHAITAAAQRCEDGDRQAEMEAMFWTIVAEPNAYVTV